MMDRFGGLDAPIPKASPPQNHTLAAGGLSAPVPLVNASGVWGLELLPSFGDLRVRLSAPSVTVGRYDRQERIDPDVDLTPYEAAECRSVSRRHAEIMRGADGYQVVDLGSANGTWINDARVAAGVPTSFRVGDVLRFGRVACRIVSN
jgi:hypothetical protein